MTGILFPTTEMLAERVRAEGPGAIEQMRPAEVIRLEFGQVLRQWALVVRDDPTLAMRLFETAEAMLDQRVTALFHQYSQAVARDGYNEGYRDGYHAAGGKG